MVVFTKVVVTKAIGAWEINLGDNLFSCWNRSPGIYRSLGQSVGVTVRDALSLLDQLPLSVLNIINISNRYGGGGKLEFHHLLFCKIITITITFFLLNTSFIMKGVDTAKMTWQLSEMTVIYRIWCIFLIHVPNGENNWIFILVKALVTFYEPHSYFTDVSTAQVWWHVSNIYMIFKQITSVLIGN